LETCFLLDHNRTTWLEPIASEALYLHALIFTGGVFLDLLSGQKFPIERQQGSYHLVRTINLLRQQLASSGGKTKVAISNPAIMAIMALASHSVSCGDYITARTHISGLYKLIMLTGGLKRFEGLFKLQIELYR